MSRRRLRRSADKVRRHTSTPTWEPRQIVRESDYVERLAYTRVQAAEALGISRSTFVRRVLPHVETIETPWGTKLIPVDELERLVAERRRAGQAPRKPATSGRPPTVPRYIVERIRDAHAAGDSLRRIAADLNGDEIPTAHGGRRWWPSTVRALLLRD